MQKIPGADKAKFDELAAKAKAGCPVSKVLNHQDHAGRDADLKVVIARSSCDEAIQFVAPIWIASRSLSSGGALRRPVGSQ